MPDASVLSISLDGSIATRDGDVFRRQATYADYFDAYAVVAKTEGETGERLRDGPLRVLPTRSRSRYLFPLDAYRIAARYCRNHPVDVVTTQDPFSTGVVGLALKRRFGLRLHTQVHVDVFSNPVWRGLSPKNRLAEPLGRFVLRHSDAVRVGTEYERDKLAGMLPSDVRITVAPVRIDVGTVVRDVTDAERRRVRDRHGLGDEPIVLFTGRFVPQKDLATWIDVAAAVTDHTDDSPQFVLTGDGPERGAVERRVRERGLSDRVSLPGWVPRDELAVYYDLADVYLITSKFEGTARVLVEAGLNELPVVATPFAGAHDNVVDGETGFVAADIATLADRVASLLADPAKRRTFGRTAREHLSERFDPDRLVERYVEFLKPAR